MSFDFKISAGDWSIGPDGDIAKVQDTDKLIQDILKMVTFPIGGNPFFPWYGSPVSKSMVGQSFDMEFLSTIGSSQINTSLSTLQKLQSEQARSQRVTPYEQIAAIQQVMIERNRVDPRNFSVLIKVATRALLSVTAELVIKPVM